MKLVKKLEIHLRGILLLLFVFVFNPCSAKENNSALIVDHLCCKLDQIPDQWIESAKSRLHIAYGHTSHGSQLTSGMDGLQNWKGAKYAWNNGGSNGALDIQDSPFSTAWDLGNPDFTEWAKTTRVYLNKSEHSQINVVIWSWCGQAGWASEDNIKTYLNLMTTLEKDFPKVKFVYMTGHLDGSGKNGNLHKRNEQIRAYCKAQNKILFDFADIESYDPDGKYFLDKFANDNCDYDSDGDESQDRNWAEEWQSSHTEGVDWFNCDAAHSKALNGNLKAYAAWWLWASLAGWDYTSGISETSEPIQKNFRLYQNYPNPFNPDTRIDFGLEKAGLVNLIIFNIQGEKISTLISEEKSAGHYSVKWNAAAQAGEVVSNGIYLCKLETAGYSETIRMIFLK